MFCLRKYPEHPSYGANYRQSPLGSVSTSDRLGLLHQSRVVSSKICFCFSFRAQGPGRHRYLCNQIRMTCSLCVLLSGWRTKTLFLRS
jgi:hypothetical protein